VALLSKILAFKKNNFSKKKFVTYNSCENKSFLNIFFVIISLFYHIKMMPNMIPLFASKAEYSIVNNGTKPKKIEIDLTWILVFIFVLVDPL